MKAILDSVIESCQYSSVAKSCLTLWNPMDCSNQASLSFTISRSLLKSCPLSWWCHATISSSVIPSPPAFYFSQHQGLFQWVSSLHQVAKVLEFPFQHQSFRWVFRVDFLSDGLVWSPCSPRDSQRVFSSTMIQKYWFFGTQPSLWSNSHICTWLLEKP